MRSRLIAAFVACALVALIVVAVLAMRVSGPDALPVSDTGLLFLALLVMAGAVLAFGAAFPERVSSWWESSQEARERMRRERIRRAREYGYGYGGGGDGGFGGDAGGDGCGGGDGGGCGGD